MEAEGPVTVDEQLKFSLIGKIYEHSKTFDNGFYTDCKICGVSSHYLIDSGSTSTLLSHRIFSKDRPTIKASAERK